MRPKGGFLPSLPLPVGGRGERFGVRTSRKKKKDSKGSAEVGKADWQGDMSLGEVAPRRASERAFVDHWGRPREGTEMSVTEFAKETKKKKKRKVEEEEEDRQKRETTEGAEH